MENYNNSEISSKVRLFQNIRCINSKVSDFCTIGDDCDIDHLVMEEKTELGRRNLIRNVTIGKGTYTGTNTIIKNTSIGKYCCLSWNISIGGGNHDYSHVSMYTDYWYKRTFGIETVSQPKETKRVKIGNDVWIAAGVNIVNGVTIGDGCVIGAGTVVTKDIPPYSIVVGVPGKIIKKRFDDEIIELLETIKWWDWTEDKIKANIDLLRNTPTKEKLKEFLEE